MARKHVTRSEAEDITDEDVQRVIDAQFTLDDRARFELGDKVALMANGGRALLRREFDYDPVNSLDTARYAKFIGESAGDIAESEALGFFTGAYKANRAVAIRAAKVGHGERSGLLSKDTSAADILVVCYIAVAQIHVGSSWLRLHASDYPMVAPLVTHSVAQKVSIVEECIFAAEELVKSARDVTETRQEFFKHWRHFRDDAAHYGDRMLRQPLGPHSCRDSKGARAVAEYDPAIHAVRTGEHLADLEEACRQTEEALGELETALRSNGYSVFRAYDRLREAKAAGAF